jgi:2-amino-4-hydroxy-6-hydroxymethyldihydropteridine diphosphokinase
MPDLEQDRGERRVRVLLGLGANVGEPVRQLEAAVARLDWMDDLQCSGIYRSAAVGYMDQPDFFNIAVAGSTTADAPEVLRRCLHVEEEMGRVRSFANAPRVIDVDVLAVGDELLDRDELTLPHPRLHERAFVLLPLCEVAPDWRHPRLKKTPGELLIALGSQRIERIADWRA